MIKHENDLKELRLLELVMNASADELHKINKAILHLYEENDMDIISDKYRELAERRNVIESSLISAARQASKIYKKVEVTEEQSHETTKH